MVGAAKVSVVKQKHITMVADRDARKREMTTLKKRNDPVARLLK
jgi:hypothetical protein